MHDPVQQKNFIKKFRQGNHEAIRYIFKSFYRPLCYFGAQLTGNQQEAEDIAIDSIIKLLEKRKDFDNLPNIKAFLYVTTRNACFDYLRSEQRHGNSHKELLYLTGEAEEQVENEMIKSRVLQEIFVQVETLPPQCQKIFKLVFFKGLSTAEIAQQMGLTARTVLNQKTRAIQLLRGTLLSKDLLPVAVCTALLLTGIAG
jgi:RNA polymerase sigma-70 factor (ECF subfamily)